MYWLSFLPPYACSCSFWIARRNCQQVTLLSLIRLFVFQLTVLRVELSNSQEYCQTLQGDLDSSEVSKDELVKKAWESRDAAVKRKNSSEVELAKERIASMQVNSQLMEAIQQKIELSQQLEQWQVDMEQLLEGQMRERLLTSSENKFRAPSSSGMSTSSSEAAESVTGRAASRIMNFFNRH